MTRFWHVLAGRDADAGATARRDRGVAEHVVGARRLLDPPRVERRERAASSRSPADVPAPGWRRPSACRVGADLLAHDARSGGRRRRGRAPTFILKCVQPVGERLAAEAADLVVGVAEPAGRRGVGGVAVAPQLAPRASPRRSVAARSRSQRLVRRQRVGDVAEVDAARRARSGVMSASSFQSGLPATLRPQVPDGVDDRGGREVDRRPSPARSSAAGCRRRASARTPPMSRVELDSSVGRRRAARAPRSPATTTSLPRPIVNVRPWPSRPSPASVAQRRRTPPSSRGPGSSRPSRRGRRDVGKRMSRTSRLVIVVIASPFKAPTRRPRVMYRSRAIAITTTGAIMIRMRTDIAHHCGPRVAFWAAT